MGTLFVSERRGQQLSRRAERRREVTPLFRLSGLAREKSGIGEISDMAASPIRCLLSRPWARGWIAPISSGGLGARGPACLEKPA